MNITVSSEGMEYHAVTEEGSELKILYGEEKPEEDNSMNPLAIFLSSLGMCVMVMLRKYFASHNLGTPKVTVEVTGDFGPDADRCTNLGIKVDVEGDWDKRRKAAFLKVAETCPVHNTICHCGGVDIEIA